VIQQTTASQSSDRIQLNPFHGRIQSMSNSIADWTIRRLANSQKCSLNIRPQFRLNNRCE